MSLLFQIFHSFLSVLGCLLNALLCHVAYFNSPHLIKTYSIITVNFAVTDFFICAVDFVLQMRMIPTKKTLIFVSYGPCSLMSSRICFYLYSILVHVYTHTIWLLFVSFCYRFYVMIRPEPSKQAIRSLLLLIYLPSLTQMILLLFEYAHPADLLSIQLENIPQYNLTGSMIFGAVDSTTFNSMFAIVHVAVMSTPIVVCIFVLRRKILNKLQFGGAHMQPSTKNLQLQLLRALTFQATIPFFYLIGVASYFVSRFEIYRNPFFEYLVFSSFLFVPVLTPISSFVFVTPYRNWILRFFRLKTDRQTSSENYSSRGDIRVFSTSIKG